MRIRIKNRLAVLLAGAGALTAALTSCSTDQPAVNAPADEVRFKASVRESGEVYTRAIETTPVSNLTWGAEPFYLNMELADGRQGQAVYKVTPGREGQLYAPDPDKSLLWLDPYMQHVFYGWTMPWTTDDYQIGDNPRTPIWFTAQKYKDMGIDPKLANNCSILEKFIGSKSGPLTYNTNGQYVELNFEHLVSKIKVNKVQLVAEDGSANENLTATMTFYQLPQSAIFDRRPADGGMPCVVKDLQAEEGVSCTVGQPTTLYVCPGIDFADMQFSIHFEGGYSEHGDYYGDFKSVIFNREDADLGDWDKGKSPTVLYAGETMTINLTMRGGNAGASASVSIGNWNTRPSRPGTGYPKKGIYSSSELLDLYNKFVGNYTQDDIDQIFDTYGEYDEDGNKILYLYDDAQMNHSRMPVAQEMILDGTGHTVQITSISHNIDGTTYPYVAHVGPCRNIFITDGKGHIIFIDENYKIWLVDSETLEMTDSGNSLTPPPPLEGTSYKSYYIDYESGANRATSSV